MIDADAVAAEIAAALADEVSRRPGDITVYEYAAAQGISVQQARARLEAGVRAGLLAKRMAAVDGHRTGLYRRRDAAGVS